MMGNARVYITSDANVQWDVVELECTQGGIAFIMRGDAREARELGQAIIAAADIAAAKRAEMMRPVD